MTSRSVPKNSGINVKKAPGIAIPLPAAFDDVRGIVERAVSMARAFGRDYLAQSRVAAQSVAAVRHLRDTQAV